MHSCDYCDIRRKLNSTSGPSRPYTIHTMHTITTQECEQIEKKCRNTFKECRWPRIGGGLLLSPPITKIVRALRLAERGVYLRVCKHGCDVKMYWFSRPNHSHEFLKVFELKHSTSLLYLPISSSAETWEIFTNMLCQFFFRFNWHFKRWA